jgi:hypothetical protein
MAVVTPDGVQAEGNVSVVFVRGGCANPAAPTLAEIAGGVDLSGYIKGGTFSPTAEQGTGDDRRLASRETYQVLGRVTRGFDDVQVVYAPQDPTNALGQNAAYPILDEGNTGDILVRWGLDADLAYATGQKVDVIPIECGAQRKVGPAENDEFARLVFSQKWGVTSASEIDATVAASTTLPTVTALAPATGPAAGGTTVVITGTSFFGTTGAAGVMFGAVNATSYVVNSNTQITAVSPAVAASTVQVKVTTPAGASVNTAADDYVYV